MKKKKYSKPMGADADTLTDFKTMLLRRDFSLPGGGDLF